MPSEVALIPGPLVKNSITERYRDPGQRFALVSAARGWILFNAG